MLRNIFLKTLRDYFPAILYWGCGLVLIMILITQSYHDLWQEPNRNKLAEDLKKAINAFSFFAGKAYDLETIGGYITSRVQAYIPLILSLFALLVGSALVRGEEEKGTLDLLLSTPHSRHMVLLQKYAALAVILLATGIVSWLGTLLAAFAFGVNLETWNALLAFLNWSLVALVFGSLALLFGQFTSRKVAAGWTGGLLAATFFVNNLSLTLSYLKPLRYFSPFHYEGLSKPLVQDIGLDWVGLLVLSLLSILIPGAAIALYERRDQGDFFRLRGWGWSSAESRARFSNTSGLPSEISEPRSLWLKNSFLFGLRMTLPGAFIWSLSIAVYTVTIVALLNDIRDELTSLLDSDLYRALGFQALATNENLLNFMLFIFLVILFAAYAVTLVAGWTAEEKVGRLELLFSTPLPRWQLLVERVAVALLALALAIGLEALIFEIAIWLFNLSVDSAKTFDTFFGLWVLGAIIIAGGFLLAAINAGRAIAITGGVVFLSYILDLYGSALKLPEGILNLSVFHLYGRPIVNSLDWQSQLAMFGISLVWVGLACFRFGQRDIAK